MYDVNYPKSPLSTIGYVYLACDDTGLVKIGVSVNPLQRLAAIETTSGRAITRRYISHMHEGYRETERALHETFKEYRFVGEWFRISFDEAVSSLKNLDITPVTEERLSFLVEKTQASGKALVDSIVNGFFCSERSTGGERSASRVLSNLGNVPHNLNRSAIEVVKELFAVVPGLDDYVKQYIFSEASLIDFGKRLLPLPKHLETSRTIPELAEELGVSPSEIIRLINNHGLTAPEYGGFDSENNFYATQVGRKELAKALEVRPC
jgi:hypothetical protein